VYLSERASLTDGSNIPTGLIVLCLAACIMKIPEPEGKEAMDNGMTLKSELWRIDYVGAVTLLGACICLISAFQFSVTGYALVSLQVFGLFMIALALAGFCGVWEWAKKDRAMISVRILRQRSVAAGSAFMLCSQAAANVVSRYEHFTLATVDTHSSHTFFRISFDTSSELR
jgi:hypothetical protein